MPPAARKGDPTAHGGLIVSGSPDTIIGNMPAARLLDKHVCPLPGHVAGPVTQTSPTVFINKLGAARLTDACTCAAPAPGAGGGPGGKPTPIRFGLGTDARAGEKWSEWRKTGDGPVEKKPFTPFNPRLTAELSKEFGKGGNYLDKRDRIFATNLTERGGRAKLAYSGDLKNLKNTFAEGSVGYEASYSAARARVATNTMRPDGSTAPGAAAEARLLTARANATANARFAVDNGRLTSAWAEGEAGAGASVVEGKATGQTKFFKIPFINRRVSFGGEVSGALLTAELRASAFAGLRDHTWSFGFSAKLGAALAGAGIKFNVVVDKIPPPEPPKAAPGVPGFAGIDPIAMGCPTVLIGSAPPPYVPGVPPKKPKPGEVVGGPGGRTVAERRPETRQDEGTGRKQRRDKEVELATQWADELAGSAPRQDPIEVAEAKAKYDKRQKENREAYERVQRGERVHPNTTPERLKLAVEGDETGRRIPLTYKSKEQFEQFQKELKQVFESEGITDATVQQVGSATSGFKGNPKKPFGHWSPTSDTDFAVFSKQSLAQAKANDTPVNTKQILGGKYPVFKNDLEGTDRGFYHTPVGKKLEAFAKKWNKELYGREDIDGIDFKLNTTPKPFGSGTATTIVQP